MAQLVCRGCHTLLMYIRGATSVQCSCCHTVKLALEAMANPSASKRFSSAMERTSQWVISQETEGPSDLKISIGETIFPLHKLIMMAKSGYIRNKIMESDNTDQTHMDLSDLPGCSEAFDMAVKFCYGINFEITVYNVAAILCAAEYLEMTERVCDGNLSTRIGEFLTQAALKTLSGAVVVLKSCETLGSFAEKTGLVQKSVEAIGLKACNEANFPTRAPADWWLSEITSLPASFLQKVLLSMKTRGAASKTLSTIITTYAKITLPDFLHPLNSALPSSDIRPVIQKHQVAVLESIISLIKSTSVSLPVSFLCLLLRTANKLNCTSESRKEVEKWIGSDLAQASVGDLLGIALDVSGKRVMDLDSVRRVIGSFVEKEGGGLHDGGNVVCSSLAMQKVTNVVDAFIGEIATEEELSVSKFAGVAAALPKSARRFDDDIYRAVDIYLKSHPGLDEIEREKVCSIMDPLRLSYEARLHASQNKRLPVQVVLHALYYDQLKLRSGHVDNDPVPSPLSASVSAGNKTGTDMSLIRENEELRSELLKMKLHLSDIKKNTKKVGKKPNFFASVSKKLGKLNPFKQESKDTLTIVDEVKVDVTKPRRRRFSIS